MYSPRRFFYVREAYIGNRWLVLADSPCVHWSFCALTKWRAQRVAWHLNALLDNFLWNSLSHSLDFLSTYSDCDDCWRSVSLWLSSFNSREFD